MPRGFALLGELWTAALLHGGNVVDFHSVRFGMDVVVTDHAKVSMKKRDVSDAVLQQVVETGDIKYKSDTHLWVFMHVEGRKDNLICAAMVLENVVVIKTVMINWELEEDV